MNEGGAGESHYSTSPLTFMSGRTKDTYEIGGLHGPWMSR
jgi:hypothetical protein